LGLEVVELCRTLGILNEDDCIKDKLLLLGLNLVKESSGALVVMYRAMVKLRVRKAVDFAVLRTVRVTSMRDVLGADWDRSWKAQAADLGSKMASAPVLTFFNERPLENGVVRSTAIDANRGGYRTE
jgi:hypothetical protein